MATDIPAWIHASNQPPAGSLATLADPAAGAEQRLNACQSLIQNGVVHWTLPHAEALCRIPEVAERAEQLVALCRILWDCDLTAPAAIPATLARDPAAGNYWMVPAGSTTTLLAFTGRARRLSVSVYLMQRILEPFGVNVIYLFDPADSFYIGGIGGGWTGMEPTVELLRRLCDGFGTRTLYCLGQSTGGYGALRYGLDLGAEAVLAFSPMIWQVMRPRPLARISQLLGRPVGGEEVDLRHLYAGRERHPRARIVCGGDNAADLRSAAMLADLPGIDRHILPGVSDHAVITTLLQSGDLRRMIGEFLGMTSPD
ncbi:hypothetical protein VY88_23420 [Azospirillum thiophilum]|uniref:Alpha/beta hydrolase n=1 Tax=Azospirillum thiophilum TaxID=528244 RepID=A0AAC8ZVY2_9PROT|nr:hypothetical protein [Azospirillum thiophilum]ALG73735.1 hypothetical protein AL072_22595 [Azospirillum thiophilum]KJR63123.1 hypothetical protein VY88_23420 [Azospirillum thiophilum]